MIAEIKRGYVPRCDSVRNLFRQQSLAQIQAFTGANGTYPNMLCPVPLNPSLPHRKIWCYLFSVSATFSVDVDMVFYLNGTEVYRQKIHVWNSTPANNQFSVGFAPVSNTPGSANETMLVIIGGAGGSGFVSAPHRLNITADKAVLSVASLTGGAALFDGFLMIQSQAGL